ncbi:metalloregulator ArsR/SmtB family transcription factor [Colwellia hornerae]|uniref:Metalloregulator ArsR/SmtB family transcription factor n=1 Tax=Colwellia hornerae TaxID=89402 RepID=A0A5C6QE03_9GAMM|nr:metalloregulator ArsR/SmtB family transcription factor [Colwellia hornerae]TWX51659.1 metalloregulator ArsR/SmtB family transcription factor [Colwellia hornerae]TWX57447.1 metalloregulator ArsR/SmtB family transcription factor [Colwellia hornerae]TWX66950.1 metalloregulator ArsR/SmtB family transcription factor [Colwellia hornerae]
MNNATAVQFFKNLADDTRLKIILLIQMEKELCVCELTTALSLSQPKISRHIAQLKLHKLLCERKVGRWVFYSLVDEMPLWQKEVIELSCLNNQVYLTACITNLIEMGNRPSRQQKCCE